MQQWMGTQSGPEGMGQTHCDCRAQGCSSIPAFSKSGKPRKDWKSSPDIRQQPKDNVSSSSLSGGCSDCSLQWDTEHRWYHLQFLSPPYTSTADSPASAGIPSLFFVMHSWLLFRLQRHRISYVCWHQPCLTAVQCVQTLLSQVLQPQCNGSDDCTHTLPNSYINSAVKITCHYITGENTGSKPDIPAGSTCWQGLKCWYLAKAVTWHKKAAFETPLD